MVPGYWFAGISTLLMTWMTPFEASTFAFVTFAPPTDTVLPLTGSWVQGAEENRG
jgi:hypothetical protein